MKIENQNIKARAITVLKWLGAILAALLVLAVIVVIAAFFFTEQPC